MIVKRYFRLLFSTFGRYYFRGHVMPDDAKRAISCPLTAKTRVRTPLGPPRITACRSYSGVPRPTPEWITLPGVPPSGAMGPPTHHASGKGKGGCPAQSREWITLRGSSPFGGTGTAKEKQGVTVQTVAPFDFNDIFPPRFPPLNGLALPYLDAVSGPRHLQMYSVWWILLKPLIGMVQGVCKEHAGKISR